MAEVRPEFRVLLGATGSVASLKLPQLAATILLLNKDPNVTHHFEVRVVVTRSAEHFFSRAELPTEVAVYDDAAEWGSWQHRGDPVLHVELARWAHALVVAPLDANTLAKFANGLCDNLLTCVARAWRPERPLVVAPAMNTLMWRHPLTARHLDAVRALGYRVLPVLTKTLVCGDTGEGAMADVATIVDTVRGLAHAHKQTDPQQ